MKTAESDALLIFGKFDPSDWITEVLMASGLRATSASNLEEARDLIHCENFKVIIAGDEIEEWPKSEIISFVRKVAHTPLLFLSESRQVSDSAKAKSLLNFDVIEFPVSPSDFLACVSRVSLKPHHSLPRCEVTNETQEFVSIPLEDFVCGKKLTYDTFLKIGINRFVKFTHGSDGFGSEQIQALKEKDISAVYLRKRDFVDYIKVSSKIIERMAEKDVEAEKKKKFIQQSFTVLGRSVILGEMDANDVSAAVSLVNSTLNLIFKSEEAFLVLELLRNTHSHVFYHSLNLSVYVAMMANQLGWTSPVTQERLIQAALFHDIGLLKLPKIIAEIPEVDQTKEEKEIYEKHVDHGLEILNSLGGFSPEILTLISHHHERDTGNGYPQKLRKNQITPQAKVIKIADDFCDFMATQKKVNLASIQQGLRNLENKVGQDYEQVYVASFKALFKKIMVKTHSG